MVYARKKKKKKMFYYEGSKSARGPHMLYV